MQNIAQDFKRTLFTTGGALALKKCFWYLISWKWAEDGSARMKTIQESPSEIYLTKGYTREVPNKIKRKEVTESERTLGVRLNPSQDMMAEIQFRHTQIKTWAVAINKSNLTRPDIYLAYNRILLMMVTYPMAVTTITENEFQPMQTLLDKTYKTNMGLNRHFQNAVYRGTPRYEGLAVAPLSTHQGY